MTRLPLVVVLVLTMGLSSCQRAQDRAPSAVPMQIGKDPKAKPSERGKPRQVAGEKSPEQLCREFKELKNANDPKANDLLGRVPEVPKQPVSQPEFEALQTDFFLRCKCQIKAVRPVEGKNHLFTLKIQETVSAPRIQIQGGGSEARSITDPTLIVEVRNGKIFGVRTGES
jgi:hypothetical protein